MSENPAQTGGTPHYDVSKEAVRRWFMELGEGFETTCRLMRTTSPDRFHVYEVRIREKRGSTAGVLLMLKGFGATGPVIAFHQDNSVLQAFINVGKRLENGSIEFEEDTYPPQDYAERAVAHSKQLEYQETITPPR